MLRSIKVYGFDINEVENRKYVSFLTVLDFGSNKGRKVKDILEEDYDYLNWCLFNVSYFVFSEEAFSIFLYKTKGEFLRKAAVNIQKVKYLKFMELKASVVHYEKLRNGNSLLDYAFENGWKKLSSDKVLSEDFIESFKDEIDWYEVIKKQRFSVDFLLHHVDFINWKTISCHWTLDELFIDKFADLLDWNSLSINQSFSEELIIKYADKINWRHVFGEQKLSLKFIDEHLSKVYWAALSNNKKIQMDEPFVTKYIDYLYIRDLLKRPDLSIELKERIKKFDNESFFQHQTKNRMELRPDFTPNNFNK